MEFMTPLSRTALTNADRNTTYKYMANCTTKINTVNKWTCQWRQSCNVLFSLHKKDYPTIFFRIVKLDVLIQVLSSGMIVLRCLHTCCMNPIAAYFAVPRCTSVSIVMSMQQLSIGGIMFPLMNVFVCVLSLQVHSLQLVVPCSLIKCGLWHGVQHCTFSGCGGAGLNFTFVCVCVWVWVGVLGMPAIIRIFITVSIIEDYF